MPRSSNVSTRATRDSGGVHSMMERVHGDATPDLNCLPSLLLGVDQCHLQ
jgi:hypothetical protein